MHSPLPPPCLLLLSRLHSSSSHLLSFFTFSPFSSRLFYFTHLPLHVYPPPRRSLYCLSLLTHSASWLPVPDSCFSQCCLCVKGRLRAQRRRGGWGQGLGSKKQNKNYWNFVVAGISSVHLWDKVLYGGCYCHAVHV